MSSYPPTVFRCGNPKCHHYLWRKDLNALQIKVLSKQEAVCKKCKERTRWVELVRLPIDDNKGKE